MSASATQGGHNYHAHVVLTVQSVTVGLTSHVLISVTCRVLFAAYTNLPGVDASGLLIQHVGVARCRLALRPRPAPSVGDVLATSGDNAQSQKKQRTVTPLQ